MLTLEFKKCLIYPDRLHVNDTCSNKFNRCWKNAFPKDYLRTKKELMQNGNVMSINAELMEEDNSDEVKS